MHKTLLQNIIGFDWDEGNIYKNLHKHDVTAEEAQEVFTNSPIIIADDEKHSKHDRRYRALGKTNEDRKLFIAFTIRSFYIRVISARPMDRQERSIYDKEEA